MKGIYTRLLGNRLKHCSMIILLLMMCIVPSMADSIYTDPFYSITQWNKEVVSDIIIKDGNNDGATWELFETTPESYNMRYRYSKIHQADDYIYLHPIRLQAGMNYEAQFFMHAGSASFAEEFSIGIAMADLSYTTTLLPAQQVDSKESTLYKVQFAVDTDSVYRLYVHCSSTANHYMLYLDSLSITECGTANVPAQVDCLTLTCDERLPNIVTIESIMPTHRVNNTILTRLDELQIYRNDKLVYTSKHPLPGNVVLYNDTVDILDNYTYSVVAVNESGASNASQRSIVAGIAPFPYRHSFADGIGHCSINDHNTDGVTWHFFDERLGGCMRYLSSATNDADDWLFTPPVYLDGSMRYQVEYSCCVGLSSYPESMSVLLGFVPRPEEMSMVIKKHNDFTFINDTIIVMPFEVQVPGIYYLAFRACSRADSYAILLRSIEIDEYDPNSVSTIVAESTVKGRCGYIEVATPHPTIVRVYNLLGTEVGTFTSHNHTQHNIASGIYLVQIDGVTHKVVVQ